MKRSILLSLMVIGAVAALITAATSAVFTDQVTSNSNTFAAGTLLLSVDGDCGTTGAPTARAIGGATCAHSISTSFTASNQKPNDPAVTHDFAIKNDGTLPGTLKITQQNNNTNGLLSCWIISAPSAAQVAGTDPLGSGTTHHYIISVQLDPAAPNTCQAAALTVNLTFDLTQS